MASWPRRRSCAHLPGDARLPLLSSPLARGQHTHTPRPPCWLQPSREVLGQPRFSGRLQGGQRGPRRRPRPGWHRCPSSTGTPASVPAAPGGREAPFHSPPSVRERGGGFYKRGRSETRQAPQREGGEPRPPPFPGGGSERPPGPPAASRPACLRCTSPASFTGRGHRTPPTARRALPQVGGPAQPRSTAMRRRGHPRESPAPPLVLRLQETRPIGCPPRPTPSRKALWEL